MQMVYGGKVLDNFDRRTLLAYLDEYLGDFLFDSFQPFHFYKGNHHENYGIPYTANTKADFLGKLFVCCNCNYDFTVENLFCLFIFLVFSVCVCWQAKKFHKCDSNKQLKLIEMQFYNQCAQFRALCEISLYWPNNTHATPCATLRSYELRLHCSTDGISGQKLCLFVTQFLNRWNIYSIRNFVFFLGF